MSTALIARSSPLPRRSTVLSTQLLCHPVLHSRSKLSRQIESSDLAASIFASSRSFRNSASTIATPANRPKLINSSTITHPSWNQATTIWQQLNPNHSRSMSSLPADYKPPNATQLPHTPQGANADATRSYGLSHTMIRVKDAHKSVQFYTQILGMTLIHEMPIASAQFTNYFLCFPSSPVPSDSQAKQRWLWQQQGVLELCHNWGTERSEDTTKYHSGNEPEHKGFGHLCIFLDDLHQACERFEKLGVHFKKRPQDGNMKNIAFILDPDQYWIEVVAKGNVI